MQVIVVIATLLGVVLLAVIGLSAAHWAVRPLRHAAREPAGAATFSVFDLLALMVVLQPGILLPAAVIRSNPDAVQPAIIVGFMLCLLLGCMWLISATALSRANVQAAVRRGVFFVIVAPMVCITALLPATANVMALAFQSATFGGIVLLFGGVNLAIALWCLAARWLTSWVVRGAKTPGKTAAPRPGDASAFPRSTAANRMKT